MLREARVAQAVGVCVSSLSPQIPQLLPLLGLSNVENFQQLLQSAFFLLQAQWPESRAAAAMCDAIRIAHPQIASDAIFLLAMQIPLSLI